MTGSEANGSWHFVLSIFAIFTILRSSEWPAPDYQNSLVFVNEIKKIYPVGSTHEEHDAKTSVSEVHVQHKIWMLPQPTNYLIID